MKKITEKMIIKHVMVLAVMMLSTLGIQAQRVLMNINKTDGTTLNINTEEVESVTFEEQMASATMYYGSTDDIPTSVTEQGTAVDIYGDEDTIDFCTKGKYVWVALPNYWRVRMYIKIEDEYHKLGTSTIQIGEYLVYYLVRNDGYTLGYNFRSWIQKTDTPITPSSYLVYYGSSSTLPNTLTTEDYQTIVVTGNSGSVAFAGNNYVTWIALPTGWTLTNVIDPMGGSYLSNIQSKVIGEYTLYYEIVFFVDGTKFEYIFNKSQ